MSRAVRSMCSFLTSNFSAVILMTRSSMVDTVGLPSVGPHVGVSMAVGAHGREEARAAFTHPVGR